MKKTLYTIFYFKCLVCLQKWESICKTDFYCPTCRCQGIIESQTKVKEGEDSPLQ